MIEFPSDRGICDLCEKKPVAPDDVFCSECRAETTASADTVTDPVERVLSDHWSAFLSDLDKTNCRCGLTFTGGPGYHRRHMAEKVYEALGIEGPKPWDFGERSPSRERFENGRIVPDEEPTTSAPPATPVTDSSQGQTR